jgi:putative transposase
MALGCNRGQEQENPCRSISKGRNMFVAGRFLSAIVEKYEEHPVSTDCGIWYPQACRFLKLQHHIHSSYEKSVIVRTMQYIKDRTESFDDCFPCRKRISNQST